MNQPASPFQKFVSAIFIFGGLGLIGAIPAGMMGLFGGIQVASEVYLLTMLIISLWFPLKVLIDASVKQQEPQWIIPSISGGTSLFVLLFGFIVIIPFLYMMTFTAFLAGVFMYLFTGNNLLMALLAAFAVQSISIYRSAQREKELGVDNNIFVRFQDMNMAQNYDISIDAQSSRAAEQPYDDEPDVLFLPAERLRQVEDDDDDEGMTIRFDSQSEEDEN